MWTAVYSEGMTNTSTAPATHDLVELNGDRVRIEYVGRGPYSIAVVTSTGDRFELDGSELTLTAEAVRGGSPAIWSCWTDESGRRA